MKSAPMQRKTPMRRAEARRDAAQISIKPMRKCKNPDCRKPFEKRTSTHVACSQACALVVARAARLKIERKKDAARKDAIKTRAQWLAEAQKAVNAYIRQRDAELPCISCGRHHQGQWHAGHYKSIGAHPELRFSELNIHKQCAPCNNHLSGNILLYRAGLIARRGVGIVEWLEGPHDPRKYSVDELRHIRAEYRAKLKELLRTAP